MRHTYLFKRLLVVALGLSLSLASFAPALAESYNSETKKQYKPFTFSVLPTERKLNGYLGKSAERQVINFERRFKLLVAELPESKRAEAQKIADELIGNLRAALEKGLTAVSNGDTETAFQAYHYFRGLVEQAKKLTRHFIELAEASDEEDSEVAPSQDSTKLEADFAFWSKYILVDLANALTSTVEKIAEADRPIAKQYVEQCLDVARRLTEKGKSAIASGDVETLHGVTGALKDQAGNCKHLLVKLSKWGNVTGYAVPTPTAENAIPPKEYKKYDEPVKVDPKMFDKIFEYKKYTMPTLPANTVPIDSGAVQIPTSTSTNFGNMYIPVGINCYLSCDQRNYYTLLDHGFVNMYEMKPVNGTKYEGVLVDTQSVNTVRFTEYMPAQKNRVTFEVKPGQMVAFVGFLNEANAASATTWAFMVPPFKHFVTPKEAVLCQTRFADTEHMLVHQTFGGYSCATSFTVPAQENFKTPVRDYEGIYPTRPQTPEITNSGGMTSSPHAVQESPFSKEKVEQLLLNAESTYAQTKQALSSLVSLLSKDLHEGAFARINEWAGRVNGMCSDARTAFQAGDLGKAHGLATACNAQAESGMDLVRKFKNAIESAALKQ